MTDSKGMITATLRAIGRSGHSAYPWLGDNALVKLHRSLASLLAAYPIPTQEAWRTTVNVARIETPNQARNPIPALAEAWLEIRTLKQAAAGQGYHADFLRKHGAADGRFYYQHGIDTVIFGIGGDGLHGPDEYADTTTITPYYLALKAFLDHPVVEATVRSGS